MVERCILLIMACLLFIVWTLSCRSAQSLSAAIQLDMFANCHLYFRQSFKSDCAIKDSRKKFAKSFWPEATSGQTAIVMQAASRLCLRWQTCNKLSMLRGSSCRILRSIALRCVTAIGLPEKPETRWHSKAFNQRRNLVSTRSIQWIHPKKGECLWFMRRLRSKVIY